MAGCAYKYNTQNGNGAPGSNGTPPAARCGCKEETGINYEAFAGKNIKDWLPLLAVAISLLALIKS